MTRAPSTKPLFRAISGKASRPDAASSMFAELPEQRRPQADQRRDEDFYPTGQPEAIRALFAYDGERIHDCEVIWEPACGDGALVREIRAMGVGCLASDLIDRGCPKSWTADFYSYRASPARGIITNPPYCEINARDGKGRWLRHTLDMQGWDYLALLLSWDWPAARANGLGELLDTHPFSHCYLMRWKLDFTGEGSPPQRNAWFVWDRRDPRGRNQAQLYPDFRWMDRVDARQEVMF
ncbi:hypothetical protein [Paracoccus methylarcula]|nr:hypothetical protein [Paracoccus methylarcula]